MSFEKAGDKQMRKIFNKNGKNAGLTKIQQLYALAWRFRLSSIWTGVPSKYTKTDFTQNLYKLDKEIEAKMPDSTSPDYNRYLAMKGISYNMRNHVDFTHNGKNSPYLPLKSMENGDFAEKALELLEPIKLTPEGIGAYLQSVFDLSHFMESQSDLQKAITNLNNAVAAIEEFEKTGKKALAEEEVFGGNAPESFDGGSKWLNEQRYRFSSKLFTVYTLLKDQKMMDELILPLIQAFFAKEQLTAQNFPSEEIVFMLWDHVNSLIKLRYFAQVNHLISFLLYHLVKNGRNAGSVAEKDEIDDAKVVISYWYANWADEVLRYTYLMVKKPKDSDVLTNPIKTEVVRFEEYVDPGVEIYENLFPVDVIKSAKKWQKVARNGMIWLKRALEYNEKSNNPSNILWLPEKNFMVLSKNFMNWPQQHIF